MFNKIEAICGKKDADDLRELAKRVGMTEADKPEAAKAKDKEADKKTATPKSKK